MPVLVLLTPLHVALHLPNWHCKVSVAGVCDKEGSFQGGGVSCEALVAWVVFLEGLPITFPMGLKAKTRLWDPFHAVSGQDMCD